MLTDSNTFGGPARKTIPSQNRLSRPIKISRVVPMGLNLGSCDLPPNSVPARQLLCNHHGNLRPQTQCNVLHLDIWPHSNIFVASFYQNKMKFVQFVILATSLACNWFPGFSLSSVRHIKVPICKKIAINYLHTHAHSERHVIIQVA